MAGGLAEAVGSLPAVWLESMGQAIAAIYQRRGNGLSGQRGGKTIERREMAQQLALASATTTFPLKPKQ
jgi:hypothetical protein